MLAAKSSELFLSLWKKLLLTLLHLISQLARELSGQVFSLLRSLCLNLPTPFLDQSREFGKVSCFACQVWSVVLVIL